MREPPVGAIQTVQALKESEGKQLYWVAPCSSWRMPDFGKVLEVYVDSRIVIDKGNYNFPLKDWNIPFKDPLRGTAFIFDNYWHAWAYLLKCREKVEK